MRWLLLASLCLALFFVFFRRQQEPTETESAPMVAEKKVEAQSAPVIAPEGIPEPPKIPKKPEKPLIKTFPTPPNFKKMAQERATIRAVYIEAADSAPRSPLKVHRILSGRLSRIGDQWIANGPGAVLQELKKTAEEEPKNFEAQRELGICELELGDLDGAIQQLSTLSLKSKDWRVTLFLGRAFEMKGEWAKALDAYTRSQSLGHKDEFEEWFTNKISSLQEKVKPSGEPATDQETPPPSE